MRKETPIPIRPRMSDESGDVVPTVDASDDEMPGGVDESKDEGLEEKEIKASEDDVMHEEGEDSRNVRMIKDPGMPTAKERAVHEATHYDYRSWCSACVKGRPYGQQHRSMVGEYGVRDCQSIDGLWVPA